jgi:hypothetical protein
MIYANIVVWMLILRLFWLGLENFDAVLKAYKLARSNLAEILSSCEMMDQESVNVVHENMGISCPIPNMPFYILIETSGSNNAHDEEKLNNFLTTCLNENVILDGMTTSEPSKMKVGWSRIGVRKDCEYLKRKTCEDQVDWDSTEKGWLLFEKQMFVFTQVLWSVRESITNSLLKDGYSYKYDVSVPLEMFYQIIIDLRERLRNVPGVIRVCGYGHLGKYRTVNWLE